MGLTHHSARRQAAPDEDGTLTPHLFRSLAPCCDYNAVNLARRLNISLRHLHRIFAATFGQTPQDWLNEERLVRARQMLLTARSVKEVAFALRFRGASQFSRDFRRRFGLVPSSLLANHRERAGSSALSWPRGAQAQILDGELRSLDQNPPSVCSAE